MADLKTTNIYGDAYINNKVGIATNAPATRLQIGQLLPTAATEGIQFGDDTSARIYRDSSTVIKVSGGFTSTTFINAGNYLQTSGNLIYPASQTATQRLEVGNASGNAWIDGLTIAQGGNVTVYNNLTTPTATVSGYITFPNDTTAAGLINTAGTAWLRLDDGGGNMHMGNVQSGAGIYCDSNAFYWRTINGATTLLSLNSNGDLGAARYLSGTYVTTSDDTSSTTVSYIMAKFGDNYHRSATAAKVAAFLNNQTMSIAGNAATATALTSMNISQFTNNSGYLTSAVTSAVAGTGISVSGATGAVTITNTGVTNISAGTGIGTSASTGAVTITNNGVTSALAGTGVGVSGATGAVTFSIGQAVGTANSPTFAGLTLSPSATSQFQLNSPSATQGLWIRSGYDTDGTATPVASANNIEIQSSGATSGTFSFVCGNTKILTIAPGAVNSLVALQQSGNQVLHAGNVSTYALPIGGGTITGNSTFSADNYLTFGPNSSWSRYLRIGGNGYTAPVTTMASVVTTNGNLHLDAAKAAGMAIYLNWYGGAGGTIFGNGSGTQVGAVDGSGNTSFIGTLGITGAITGASFSGAGTGLTGTAASLTAGAVTNGVYTNTNNTLTAINTINNSNNTVINTLSGNLGLTMYQATTGTDAYMTFHISGDYAAYFGLGGAENDLVYGGWSVGNVRHRILHSGNATYAWNMNQFVRTTDSPTFNTVTANITGNAYNNLSNNYKDIYVYGDVNTYYVVLIQGESLYSFGRYSVTRGYNWTGPDTWNNASHKGGLTLDWEWSGDTAWGGNDKAIRIIEFNESYSTMVAGLGYPVNGGVIIWLRGGGVNGALYRIRTPVGSNSTVTIYDNLSIAGHVASTTFTAANSTVFSTRANVSNVSAEILVRYPVRDTSGLYVDNNAVLHAGNYNSYSPTLTGTGASGTWGISVTGNAGTATILQTARNINGTSFNGSAAITTATWGTARTLTIGSTGKSVDGSAAITWSLAEIGAAATNQTMFVGTTSVAINRASAAQTLTGVSIDGSAASCTGNAATATGQQSGVHFTLNTGGAGYGLVGQYNADLHQGLFAMGAAYTLGAGGTLANFYGVSWSYDYAGRQLNTGYNLQHCMAVANAGVVATVIGLGIWTNGLIRANGAISSAGTITAAAFSGPLTGNATTATNGFTSKPGWAGNTNLIQSLPNFNNSVPSGFYEYTSATNSPSATWYNLINVRHSNTGNDHGFQLAMSYYDNNLWFRSYQGGTGANNGTFQSWAKTLSDQNYTDYTVTKTGTGASGTWAINVTGNAATATTATNVTIANGSVTLAKIENITAYTILGNSNASAVATPAALSVATVATMLSGQTMNINGSSTSCSGNAASATLATKASTLSQNGGNGTGMTFNWSGQGGQPTWLWGSNDGSNIYVWNPSNFNVNYATSAGSATSAGTATSAGSATTAGSCSGNAATATNVAASGITGQTGMWTSAARPGPYRLYRNDDDSAYNVQLTWQAHRTSYWSLRGFLNDGFHAECFVVYSGYADSAGSAGALTTGNTYQVASLGIGVAASNKLHINGDGSNPTIRIDNTAFGSGTSSSRGFFGWLPISISGVTRYIQLYS